MPYLKTIKGNIGIMVWRRNAWVSMPHMYSTANHYFTECGREIALGNGITAVTLTAVTVDMFTVVGCGHCTQALLKDLKHELYLKNIEVHNEWKAKLKTLEWYRPGDSMPRT